MTAIDDEEAQRLADLAPVVRKPFDFVDFVDAVRGQLETVPADQPIGG